MNAPALIRTVGFTNLRIPYNDALEDFGIDNVGWKVLQEAVFPNAKTLDSIVMALTYCRRRNLDIFKKPVHIVPMYSSAVGGMIDTVWPSISELRTTAFRTSQYAGHDEIVYGPTVKEKLGDKEVRFPEWAQMTVYRILNGQRYAFPGPRVHWLEAYARKDRQKDTPNEMWLKRPFGQIDKCAEAAAIRGAFPEEVGNDYAAEEMEGQRIIADVEPTPTAALISRAPPPPPEEPSEPNSATEVAPPTAETRPEPQEVKQEASQTFTADALIPASSNGRTTPFEGGNRGSTPRAGTSEDGQAEDDGPIDPVDAYCLAVMEAKDTEDLDRLYELHLSDQKLSPEQHDRASLADQMRRDMLEP